MGTLSVLTGLGLGFILAYALFSLLNKTKNVARSQYDALNTTLHETSTALKIAEDRLVSKTREHEHLTTRWDTSAQELTTLRSKFASLETASENDQQKNSVLAKQLSEQATQHTHLQNEINALKQTIAEFSANNRSLAENLDSHKQQAQTLQQELARLNDKQTLIVAENSKLQANNQALSDKLATQKEEITEMQKTSHLQFEKIANQILEEKSGRFTEANKANIEALLKPLGENIETFKKRVEETYDKESKIRYSLEEKVKELIEQTNKVSAEANNLATALKGQVKKQGNWGEMILESILQKSGLVKDREYFLQATIKDEEGNNLRPDVLVKLPDNRIIIIDSKVSLVAYDRFSSAESTEEQALHLADHLKSIYTHIDSLHGKKYDSLESALDFTMMFIPIEPAYLVSIQSDQDLWAYAYSKRILLISPTNLIACLKLMADLWKRELQSKNAMEIVKRGELLYDKFVNFATTIEELGKHIDKTQRSYSAAINQLNSGPGNLVKQAEKLKELGLKSNKEIPAVLQPKDFEPEAPKAGENEQQIDAG